MPVNVEIKARIRDWAAMESRASAVAKDPPRVLEQEDTFFSCREGRLKLRIEDQTRGQLIYYRRPDRLEPTASLYHVTAVEDPQGLKAALTQALGVCGRVTKERTVYLAGRTRIHLDRVCGLGQFVELEVVLEAAESEAAGRREAEELMGKLHIRPEDLVECAYADLLPSEA
jgi:predicted adenylyl cyclase CyaB